MLSIIKRYTVYHITSQVQQATLSVGSTVPINTLITALESHKDSSPTSFPYLADHLKKVANVAVRNVRSIDVCVCVCVCARTRACVYSHQVILFIRSAVGPVT